MDQIRKPDDGSGYPDSKTGYLPDLMDLPTKQSSPDMFDGIDDRTPSVPDRITDQTNAFEKLYEFGFTRDEAIKMATVHGAETDEMIKNKSGLTADQQQLAHDYVSDLKKVRHALHLEKPFVNKD